MSRIVKIIGLAVGGLVLVFAAALAYVVATFNPNDYKPAVIKLVKEKTGRTLAIPGTVKLSFYPKIGADLGAISLSEHGSEAEFAAIENAKVSLALLPLLKKDVVVDRVIINGARAHLIRNADGSMNIDDLLTKQEEDKSQAVKFAIDDVKIGNASVDFDDRKEHKTYQATHFNLDSGPIANGVASQAALSASVKLTNPAVTAAVVLKTGFTIDTDKKHYVLDGLDASISGALASFEKAELTAAGDVDLDLAQSRFALSGLKLGASLKHGSQNIDARLALPAFKGDSKAVHLPGLTLDASIKDSGLDSSARLAGDVDADLDTTTLSAKLKGKLDDSNIDLVAGLRGAAINFALTADKLDLARYQSKQPAPTPDANAPEQPIDLSGLRGLNVNGTVRIGALKASGLQATKLALDLHGGGDKFAVNPIRADLYGGSVNGGLALDFAGNPKMPRIALTQNLTGIQLGALLQDVMKKAPLEGKGDVTLEVTTQGATVSALRRDLAGTARLKLADGAVSGFNLAQMVRNAKAMVGGGARTGTSNAADKTDFTELTGSFRIANGVAHNDDLSAKTPLFRIGGAGDIDIGREQLNYTVKATVVASLEGQGGPELQSLRGLTVPVKLDGPFTAIQWHIDFGSMAKEAVTTKVQDKLKDAFQNLFNKH